MIPVRGSVFYSKRGAPKGKDAIRRRGGVSFTVRTRHLMGKYYTGTIPPKLFYTFEYELMCHKNFDESLVWAKGPLLLKSCYG